MSFNGSGTYTPPAASFPEVPDTLIDANRYDAVITDLAAGVSNTICKDGQTTLTANIPFSGFKATNMGKGTARTDSATLANIQDGTGVFISSVTGTGNAIILGPSPAISAYVMGQTFRFVVSTVNTTAVTVAISGLAAKAVVKGTAIPLIAGDLTPGQVVDITYDGTQFLLLNNSFFLTATGSTTARLLADRFAEIINVKDYGAAGDGVTDDTTAIQAAIDYANARGGGIVWFPTGTYRVQRLQAKNTVLCKAVFGSVTLKVVSSVDKQVFYNPNSAVPTTVDYFGLEGLICDGNQANALGSTATSVCDISGVTYFYAKDCIFQNGTGYGLGFQAHPGIPQSGVQTQIYCENCHFLSNGIGVGGDQHDGLDIKDCDIVTLVGCVANGNFDNGIDVRGERIAIIGGCCSDNATNGYEVLGNTDDATVISTAILTGCTATGNGNAGFRFASGGTTPVQPVRVVATGIISTGNVYGIHTSSGSYVDLVIGAAHCVSNSSHGIFIGGGALRSCHIDNCLIHSNGGSGIGNTLSDIHVSNCKLDGNTRYGWEELSTGTRSILGGATTLLNNTIGSVLYGTNRRLTIAASVLDFAVGTEDIIASATTITLPEGGQTFYITGTTTITTITPSYRNRIVYLQFTGILTLTHGTNIRLASGTNITTGANATVTLMSDGGSVWRQIAYSANT